MHATSSRSRPTATTKGPGKTGCSRRHGVRRSASRSFDASVELQLVRIARSPASAACEAKPSGSVQLAVRSRMRSAVRTCGTVLSYDDHESCVVIVVFAVAASPRLALLRLAGDGVARSAPAWPEVDALRDVFATEDLLGVPVIVESAAHSQVCWVITSAERLRVDVIELEIAARRAPVSLCVDVGALLAVASEDLAADRPRDVPPACLLPRSLRLPLILRLYRPRHLRRRGGDQRRVVRSRIQRCLPLLRAPYRRRDRLCLRVAPGTSVSLRVLPSRG